MFKNLSRIQSRLAGRAGFRSTGIPKEKKPWLLSCGAPFIKSVNTLKPYGMVFMLLLIYVVTIPLMKTPRLPVLAQRIQLSEIAFLFLFFPWVIGLAKQRRLPQDTGVDKPFLLFVIFCLFSFFNSTDLFLSVVELYGLLYLFIMLILVADVVDNKMKLDRVVKVWIGTLSVVLALGLMGLSFSIVTGERNIFCRVYHGIFPYLKDSYRVQSTFRHPQGLGSYLIVSLGFIASELLLTENKRYKIFLKILLFLMCLTMILTISKSIVGFSVAAFLIYNHFHELKNLRFKATRTLFFVFIAILFLCVNVFFSSFYIRSFKIENPAKRSHKELIAHIDYAYDVRLAKKISALEMIKRHPFVGVGLATYPLYTLRLNQDNYFVLKNLVPIYYYPLGTLDFLPVGDPHNDILGYLAETGALGGGAFIFFIALFLYLIFANLKRMENKYFKVRLFCFSAAFIGMLIESIDLDVFKLRHLWFLMALIIALMLMQRDKAPKLIE